MDFTFFINTEDNIFCYVVAIRCRFLMERIYAHCYGDRAITSVTCPRINYFIISIFQSKLCSRKLVSAYILFADLNIALSKLINHYYRVGTLTVNSYFSFSIDNEGYIICFIVTGRCLHLFENICALSDRNFMRCAVAYPLVNNFIILINNFIILINNFIILINNFKHSVFKLDSVCILLAY